MQSRLPTIKLPKSEENKQDEDADKAHSSRSFLSTQSLNNFTPTKPTIKEYFGEVYNTLCSQDVDIHDEPETKGVRGVNSIVLLHYTRLPKLVNDRLFFAFSGHLAEEIQKDGSKNLPNISKEDFINGFELLTLGTLQKKLRLVFKMLDFNDDGLITREDCRILLSHIPTPQAAKLDSPRSLKLSAQKQSEEAISQVLNEYFSAQNEKEALDFQTFNWLAFNNASDIQLSILLYLLENLKLEAKLFRYETYAKDETGQHRGRLLSCESSTRGEYLENSTSGSPRDFAIRYKDISLCVPPKVLKKHGVLGDFLFTKPLKRKSVVNLSPETIELSPHRVARRKSLVSVSPRSLLAPPGFSTPSGPSMQIENEAFDLLGTSPRAESVAIDFSAALQKTVDEAKEKDNYEQVDQDTLFHQGYMYRKLDESKLKKYWYELRGSELYVFRKQKDSKYKQLLLLGMNVHLIKEPTILKTEDNKEVMSFSMVFGRKRREFFLVSRKELQQWMKMLSLAINKPSIHGKYKIGKFLGKGKFGDVHLAVNQQTNQEVAVKIINKGKMSKDQLNSLTYEIDILKLCQHPYIIELKDLFEDQYKYYLVQEYVSGGSLYQYLRNRKTVHLREKLIRELVFQIADAILYLKNHGIMHRDLKPDNIMLSSPITSKDQDTVPHLKVVDFGLSTIIGPTQKSRDPFGTLTYVAPEILLAKGYDFKVDVYSLGVIFYEFMKKSVPFHDRNQDTLLEMIIEDKPDFSTKVFSQYSDDCLSLAKKLLQKSPKLRPAIEEVLKDKWLSSR